MIRVEGLAEVKFGARQVVALPVVLEQFWYGAERPALRQRILRVLQEEEEEEREAERQVRHGYTRDRRGREGGRGCVGGGRD